MLENLWRRPDRQSALEHYRELAPGYDASCRAVTGMRRRAWALTTVRGNGQRKIAIFSDPYCPYCQRFENDLAKLDDIRVQLFLYPVIRPESVDRTKSVWCSKDRATTWNDRMLRGIRPTAAPTCATPIEKIVALGKGLGASATPAWFLPDGVLRQGAMQFADLRALLDASVPHGAPAGGGAKTRQ